MPDNQKPKFSAEWSGLSNVSESGSPKTIVASSKETSSLTRLLVLCFCPNQIAQQEYNDFPFIFLPVSISSADAKRLMMSECAKS
jgi:hypothetical protein